MKKSDEDRILKRIDELLSKADEVLATGKKVGGWPSVDTMRFAEWKTGVQNLIANFLGKEHIYFENFSSIKRPDPYNVREGVGILKAIREDLESGFLIDIKILISAEIFTDFLEMAEHLIENGYKDAAASLTGAVLEDGLRRVAKKNEIGYKKTEGLAALNNKLKKEGIYNPLTHKKVETWREIRNSADHGKFNEYGTDDVKKMHEGVVDFLEKYL